MIFEHVDLKIRNPYLSLALDEAFCLYLARQQDSGVCGGVRLWSTPSAIVLGRTCDASQNIENFQSLRGKFKPDHRKGRWSEQVSLMRRLSGGGTVLHGPGNINYSIFVSLKRYPSYYNLKESYTRLLSTVQKGLEAQGIQIAGRGLSDLVMVEKNREYKISGNAQFRKSGMLVLHGTLITRLEFIGQIEEHLQHPPKEPDYRAGREHKHFLSSLPENFDVAAFYQCFSRELKNLLGVEFLQRLPVDAYRQIFSLARQLTRHFYTRDDWVLEGNAYAGKKAIRVTSSSGAAASGIARMI